MTTVYAVWKGHYAEDRFIDAVFATRELAERYQDYTGSERRAWERLVRKSGTPIPGAFWVRTEKDADGKVIKRWQEPKTHKHPGSFEDFIRYRDKGEIEELEVLDTLPK